MNEIKDFTSWNNKGVAVITGASSGIGASFARSISGLGFEILLIARRKSKLEAIAKEIEQKNSIKADILVADLSILEEIEMVAKKIAQLNNVDILINNAGFGTRGYFDKISLDTQLKMMSVHMTASVYFCRSGLPIMIKRGRGAIINVASIAAYIPRAQSVMYGSTKAFLKMFSESLQIELEGTGVKIQALCPGYTHTEFHYAETYKNFDSSTIPEDVWMSKEDVVDLSLDALRKKEVVFIPGERNQKFIKLYQDPERSKELREDLRKSTIIPRS
ncbi:hypothetical protein LCGC14_0591110 [marine sediment metagenome]|uniref:Short-chain dehydrogenase/reductase SDR n=1 Tax=marine sediment metagenome TaxID=412755 RepID=A0A0F9RXA7_9ZZZZ|nr:SDR family oxidoreductase [archaeon]HEC38317.1 SDR family oxidoreductase [bacterium]